MNKKGFTLIELLAVIVVLAIIMVLATTTVLPLMTTARKKLFLDEAEAAIESAINVMSLKELGQVTGLPSDPKEYKTTPSTSNTVTCFTLYALQQTGLYTIDANKVKAGGQGDYAGWVKITQQAGTNKYTYQVRMHNTTYFIGGSGTNGTDRANLIDKNVVDYASQGNWTCT